MRASSVLLSMGVIMFALSTNASAQFFTKTTANSIPRMGRSSDQALPNLVRRLAKTLRFVIHLVQKYDEDRSGELSPEELLDVPELQNAAREDAQYVQRSRRQLNAEREDRQLHDINLIT